MFIPHLLFPSITFRPNRLIFNELGSFDNSAFENAELQSTSENTTLEKIDDSEDLAKKYSDAVFKLEQDLSVTGLSSHETTSELKQLEKQKEFLTDVEELLNTMADSPNNFEHINLQHVTQDPNHVESVLRESNKSWQQLADHIKSQLPIQRKTEVSIQIETAISVVLTERILAGAEQMLQPDSFPKFERELKQNSDLKELYSLEKPSGTLLSHEDLDEFAEKYTPVLVEAFKKKNDAYAKLPSLTTEDEEQHKTLADFLSKYPSQEEVSETPAWNTLLENIQADIEEENDPVKKREKFDEFIEDCKDQFGSDIEIIILEAIESDQNFKQLSYLITTTSTKEQAIVLKQAVESNAVTELYYASIAEEPTYFYKVLEEKLTVVRTNSNEEEITHPANEPHIIPTEIFFRTMEDKPQLQELANWLDPDTSKITENENGSLTIQQDESTQITLPPDYFSNNAPLAKVTVGQEPFTENGEGSLAEIDKIVEQANSILFVRYGLDAEELIPGGLNSHMGRELALKLAGLFFFDKGNEQKSSEKDNKYENLKTKTGKVRFQDSVTEFFGIDVSINEGVSRDGAEEQLRVFLAKHDLLTITGVLKPEDDISWQKVRQKKESYLAGINQIL